MPIIPSRSVPQHRPPERRSIIVDSGTRNRFEVTFEGDDPVEIKIERWAECTTGKRFWARCWMPERPLIGLNGLIVELARALLTRPSALPLIFAAGVATDLGL